MAVRDSTVVGAIVMDAIDARPKSYSISLHDVPPDELASAVARLRAHGWTAERSSATDATCLKAPEAYGADIYIYPAVTS